MRHLTPDEFVDLLEGARGASGQAHLASCPACRRQLEEARTAMAMAAGADVPEPSPLFWNHFSERVRAAIERDAQQRSAWFMRLAVPAAALLAAAAVVLMVRTVPQRLQPAGAPSVQVVSDVPVHEGLPEIDDSLALVADLTSSFDVVSAGEAGLTSRGDAEHAVTHLDDGELRELRRLIEQEMVNQ